jgi:assimilatory nitrate reductase catalytic subunit
MPTSATSAATRRGPSAATTEALKGAYDVDDIGKRLKAGTNCGACRPEIAKLLHAGARDAQPA